MALPADNGHASVVMDTDTHRTKMSGPYKLLKKGPTHRLIRKLSEKLLALKRGDIYQAPFTTKSDLGTHSLGRCTLSQTHSEKTSSHCNESLSFDKLVQFWTPSSATQRRGERTLSPQRCVTGEGVQNWTIDKPTQSTSFLIINEIKINIGHLPSVYVYSQRLVGPSN